MELNVIEQSKNKLIFDIKGEDHTLCNAIVKELWNDKDIKATGYTIDHPLTRIPRMVVETTTSSNPKKSLLDAVKRLKKTSSDMQKKADKELK